MRQVAVNIRLARQAAGHSQESLARALDVSYSAVQGWESLTTQRSPWRSLPRLAAVLDRHVSWFFVEHPGVDYEPSEVAEDSADADVGEPRQAAA